MAKKSFSSSLADKLKSAGIMDPVAAQAAEQAKVQEEAAARTRQLEEARQKATVEGICAYYASMAPRGATLAERVAWGASWFDELTEAGHGAELERQRIMRPSAGPAPVGEAELAGLEEALGCSLPPSLRRMLGELGGVDWGTEGTLAAGEIVEHVAHLRGVLDLFRAPLPELAPYQSALQLIPISSIDGNHDFVLRNVRDARDESPIYFVYHDEAHLYGGAPTVEEWFEAKLEQTMERFADRGRVAARGRVAEGSSEPASGGGMFTGPCTARRKTR